MEATNKTSHWIIETPEGRVLRFGDIGLTLGGSDPTKYSTHDAARKVSETMMGIASMHGKDLKLIVKPHDNRR